MLRIDNATTNTQTSSMDENDKRDGLNNKDIQADIFQIGGTSRNSEMGKSVLINTTFFKNDDSNKETTSQNNHFNESVEPMGICDSQEYINLVIDEISNNNDKEDEEINMDNN